MSVSQSAQLQPVGVGHPSALPMVLPMLNNSISRAGREQFASTLAPHVQVMLSGSFGEDSCEHCFALTACLRHVLILLWKLAFLDDWRTSALAAPKAKILLDLVEECGKMDFNALWGHPSGALKELVINEDCTHMHTAGPAVF